MNMLRKTILFLILLFVGNTVCITSAHCETKINKKKSIIRRPDSMNLNISRVDEIKQLAISAIESICKLNEVDKKLCSQFNKENLKMDDLSNQTITKHILTYVYAPKEDYPATEIYKVIVQDYRVILIENNPIFNP